MFFGRPVPESTAPSQKVETPATVRPASDKRASAAFALATALITFLVFSPVLRNGFVDVWDDQTTITHNPDFNPPRLAKLLHYWVPPPKDEFYVPVHYTIVGLTSMLARSTSRDGVVVFNPAPFHAASLIAHALAAMLVFLILMQLVNKPWAAFAGVLVFALHPIQAEAVAWASTLYTPLSGMLGLAAVWQFLHRSRQSDLQNRRAARIHYAWATLFFVLAMLTKPAAASVPLIIAAIEISWRKRRALSLALPLGAWILLAIPIVLATKLGTPAGTVGRLEPWQRAIVALDAVAFYLGKIFWPLHLTADYGRSPSNVLADPRALWICLVPIALIVIARMLRVRAPWLGAAVGVFIAGLLPTLGLASFNFQAFSTVANRFAYFAMLAIAMLVAVIASRLSSKVLAPLLVLTAGGLGALSIVQLRQWQNPWTLFASTIEARSDSRIVGSNIRFMFTPEVEAHCTLPPAQLVRLGDLLMGQKRAAQAAPVYELAIVRGSGDSAAYDRLAEALLQSEKRAEAERAAREALALNPNDAAAHATLGDLYIRDDVQRAAEEYRHALRLDSGNARARRGLAATSQ
jgi:hypothetical protein